jgi:SAM-dependent methyltransferase
MALFDRCYVKEDYFGRPFKELIEFFEGCERGSLADLGAGQGRDSIPLYELGFSVTAIDISSVGLEQIGKRCSGIKTLKEDILSFDVSSFDYVLTDSMFHFNPAHSTRECTVLEGILDGMQRGAVFVNCMKEGEVAERTLAQVVNKNGFVMVEDMHIWYHEGNCEYHMLAVKKL